MKDLRGTYVHRGDRERRRRRIRAGFMFAGLLAAAILAARTWEPHEASAAAVARGAIVVAAHHDGAADQRLEFAELPKTISGKIRRVELRAAEARRRAEGGPGAGEFWEEDFPELGR